MVESKTIIEVLKNLDASIASIKDLDYYMESNRVIKEVYDQAPELLSEDRAQLSIFIKQLETMSEYIVDELDGAFSCMERANKEA